jgi:hypothetical protein
VAGRYHAKITVLVRRFGFSRNTASFADVLGMPEAEAATLVDEEEPSASRVR